MQVTPELLRQVPLFSDLGEMEFVTIAGCFTHETFGPGETLYIEGESATCACFVIEGELEALKALPGGGQTQVAIIKAGHMIGEMALVTGGTRAASVRAITSVTVLRVLRDFFHAALEQISAPAFKILRGVTYNAAAGQARLQTRLLHELDCDSFMSSRQPATLGCLDADDAAPQTPSFDYLSFLPSLPFFSAFTQSELNTVTNAAGVVQLRRGDYLYREQELAEHCWVVVRGAVETSVMRDRRYQLSVIGPGRLCGADALIIDTPRNNDARTRSETVLLVFDKQVFTQLYTGNAPECLKFQRMININQLEARRKADNLLSILVNRHYQSDGGELNDI